jgi:peptidoglycan hydrolase-like protein with peptidoglycan-binding domain
MRAAAIILVTLTVLAGCSDGGAEKRGREALEKIKESMPDIEAKALGQKVTPEQVQRAQEQLLALKEYLGEANGRLDAVTVNSIEAFQRSRGIEADGILNEKTQRLLQQAVAKQQG